MNELVETNQTEIKTESEYKPSVKQALREYEVSIRFLSRGCVVRVGCQEIPFETVDAAMTEINAYVAEPWEMQKKWREILK